VVEPALIAHPVLVDLRVRARLQALDSVVHHGELELQPRLHDAQTLSVFFVNQTRAWYMNSCR